MPPEITVKVLSYNVFMRDLADAPGLKKFLAGLLTAISGGLIDPNTNLEFFNEQRAPLIADLIARGDYDVLVFQEAFDNGARDKLVGTLQRAGFKHMTTVVGLNDTFTSSDGGIFIMSRWPIVNYSQIVYRNAESDDRLARKGVSWAQINKDGFYFNVFGTHTQADGGGVRYFDTRYRQFEEFRKMMDGVGLYWQPALLAGDMNVDFAETQERTVMLKILQAELPQNRSRHTPTSDPANELKSDTDRPTTLDYVLYADDPQPKPLRPAPLRSSLETVRLRTPYQIKVTRKPGFPPTVINLNDLSDHYAVSGTYTFEKKREDTPRLVGTWKSVLLNNQPDPRDWRITFTRFGRSVESVINGNLFDASIHYIAPGEGNKGKVTFWNGTLKRFEEYYYSIGQNRDFQRYFVPGDKPFQRHPPADNELMIRTLDGSRTTLFAYESWLPEEKDRPPRIP